MKDFSGVRWTPWPLAGAVGAGRSDELPAAPEGFGLTPSAFSREEEVPDGSPGPE
jgi:hypothetical protein